VGGEKLQKAVMQDKKSGIDEKASHRREAAEEEKTTRSKSPDLPGGRLLHLKKGRGKGGKRQEKKQNT